MTTIAPTPPAPARAPASAASAPVTRPSTVERPKERSSRQRESGRPDDGKPGGPAPDDLSDELLLKVVRAISGERGVIVDKKV